MGRLAAIAISIALLAAVHAAAAVLVPGGVVLTNRGGPLVQFDPSGGGLSLVSGQGAGSGPAFVSPQDVALGPDGLLYVADNDVGVLRVDPATGDREVLLAAPSIGFARSVAFDSKGYLFVLDADNSLTNGTSTRGDVLRLDLVTGRFDVVLRTFASASTLLAPRDLAITAFDQLLFADRPGRVKILHPDGSLETRHSMNAQLSSLTVDPLTDLPYVVAYSGPGGDGLYAGTPNGGFRAVSNLSLGTGLPFWGPLAAAVDHDGSVYVTDLFRGLFRVDPATGNRALVVDSGNLRLEGVIVLPETLAIEDVDADGVADVLDVCPDAFDPGQEDTDGNRVGDACNDLEDPDGDELADSFDNCPFDANPGQVDSDGDGLGDACNDAIDLDGDEIHDDADNCPEVPNDQSDFDGDDLGDACDPFPLHFDNEKEQLRVDLAVCLERDVFDDADGDGEEDATDACPQTPEGVETDSAGCSQEEFCASHVAGGELRRALVACYLADWRNDEPATLFPRDCRPRLFPGLACEAISTYP